MVRISNIKGKMISLVGEPFLLNGEEMKVSDMWIERILAKCELK